MSETAHHKQKIHALVTNLSSYLGQNLAEHLISAGCVVYGVGGGHLPHNLLSNRDFTLLEIDLSQPLPAYLPEFDFIFDLSLLSHRTKNLPNMPDLSPQLSNVMAISEKQNSKVMIFAPIETTEDFYEYLTRGKDEFKQKTKLFLLGDLYGPKMSLSEHNLLADMIKQAVKTDKIILENEGLDRIYPVYITDVLFAINKFTFSNSQKQILFLSSESPKTALSVAYEIQSVTRIVANKELGLFFSGPQPLTFPKSEIQIKNHDTGYSPKVDLSEGLKKTLEYFSKENEIELSQIHSLPRIHQHAPQQATTHVLNENLKHEKTGLTKIPSISLGLNLRLQKVVLAALLLLLLTLLKTGLDIYLGKSNLNMAQQNLQNGDFVSAKANAVNSRNSFKAAANKVKLLTYPLYFIWPAPASLGNALEAASAGADAAAYFVESAGILAHDLSIITSLDAKNEGFDLETPAAGFKKSYFESSRALQLVNSANPFFEKQFLEAKQKLVQLHSLSQRAYEISNLVDEITGQGAKKTYLVLLQNNTELRPGGGFIGNFALIEFEDGKLQNISVEDIYTIDGQLKEKIDPPAQLKEKLGVPNLYLRDSNWSGDFELNARTARDFFKKETGRDVDGVIAVDLTLVQNILEKMGPITLTDYQEEITAQNLFERGEYYSEIGFFPGSTQKRDFFGALTRTMVSKILESLKNPNQDGSLPWLDLIDASGKGLPEKHLMMTFDEPTLASFVRTKGWNHPLPPTYFNPADDVGETRDYLALLEANLGANKVNRFLDRKITYEMTIGKDADLVGKITITYTNNSQAETWPAGKYVNFLRVYAPFAASLFDYSNGESKNLEEVETTSQGNLTVFSTYVEVPIRSQKEVSFTYRIPKNIKLEEAPVYSLYIQKQAGTSKDPLEIKFNLPSYLQVEKVNGDQQYSGSQNVVLETDLSSDRHFTIGIAKK